MHSEQTRQTRNSHRQRQNRDSFISNIQPQNPTNTLQSYQPNQTQNEIPLLYPLQKHEIEKIPLTKHSQVLIALSWSPNKPLMVLTGTDPE